MWPVSWMSVRTEPTDPLGLFESVTPPKVLPSYFTSLSCGYRDGTSCMAGHHVLPQAPLSPAKMR